ncbi:uncharacterized protein EV154DRAFT_455231 [Mucor mucedo]|uniref:uncharacterized protein n=1 Tax=Mucor mucedo TaxID=29922 RepID=UPI00221FD229|nr:uncharacterized protein EV154DRAFT_455231 [Mucor mucedo]KAI7897106.1 hypothetical protein EV154DRAFT_455231 [Mucor mucedo]
MSGNGYSSIPESGEGSTHHDPLIIKDLSRAKKFELYVRRHFYHILALATIAIILITLAVYSVLPDSSIFPSEEYPHTIKSGVSEFTMDEGRAKCDAIKTRPRNKNLPNKKRANPRAEPKQIPILIKNAIVWDGQGEVLNNVDIYIKNGVISKVEKDIQLNDSENVKVIDAAGHVVGPGLVDMHSHMGVDSWPEFDGTQDTNEMTQPLTPFVRTIDAFNPSDNAIRIVASGGVTTVLVLPGSGNIVGGEAFSFKLRPVETLSNEDMLVQAHIDEEETKWRWMKMACGENPKRVYGNQRKMPSTRLGEAYLLRSELSKAQELKREQDDWCEASQHSHSRFDSAFPQDLSLESLVSLLRGEVLLNIHCYETHDIEAMVRHSLEFNFTISAFHHALDAYRVPAILRRAHNNITVATFADHWGYKKEAFQGIPEAPKILYEAGIPVALKSDHPVLNSQHLIFEAAKTTHYGLPPQEAFKAVTSTPANAIGLGHRIGSLRVGYDADLVIWDREPLELGATPLQVFVDGVPLFDETVIKPTVEKKVSSNVAVKNVPKKLEGAKSFILKNAGYSFLGKKPTEGPIQVVVEDGAIVCSAADCSSSFASIQSTVPEFDLQGGYVLPGLVAVGSHLGLSVIEAESTTGDGVVAASSSHDPKSIVEAIDGLKFGGRKLEEAYKGGILTTITAPMSDNVVIGVSAAFRTSAESVLQEGALISPATALHVQIGDSVKSSQFPTVSSQISFLRQIFSDNLKADNRYGQAARGEIPLIVSVNNKDEIATLIRLKESTFPDARLAILGGIEAYLLAAQLAKANIAVILNPGLCTPANFDSIHCLTGAPLTNGTAAHVLNYHGVKLGVAVADDGLARNLAWDSVWFAATSPSQDMEISEFDAIKFVTTNLQEIFGLKTGNDVTQTSEEKEEFVVWSGSPLDVQSRILFIHTKNSGIHYPV